MSAARPLCARPDRRSAARDVGTQGHSSLAARTTDRVVALGRKVYLFFGNPRAGRSFAGLYSLVGSSIANGVEPTVYLTDALMRVRDANTDEELDALLSDRWRPIVTPAQAIVEVNR